MMDRHVCNAHLRDYTFKKATHAQQCYCEICGKIFEHSGGLLHESPNVANGNFYAWQGLMFINRSSWSEK